MFPRSFQFRHLSPDDRPDIPDLKAAVSMTAININVPVYLPYLFSHFLAQGGTIVRGTVQHVNQVLEGGISAFTRKHTREGFNEAAIDALVVCAGMGTRTLGGVEDQSVYPVRGQTVLLHAPWVKAGMSLVPSSAGSGTYVIPRRNGDVRRSSNQVVNCFDEILRLLLVERKMPMIGMHTFATMTFPVEVFRYITQVSDP